VIDDSCGEGRMLIENFIVGSPPLGVNSEVEMS
jgi:hypothetical protein